MDEHERRTAVAAFPSRQEADAAVTDLEKVFGDSQIGMVARQETAEGEERIHEGRDHATGAAVGVGSGAVMGTIVGAAVALLIPGAGPVVAAGVLASTLVGMGTGAVAGGLMGALTGLGISKVEAEHYHREFEAGRTLVTVDAGAARYAQAREILRRHGGQEMSDRESAASDGQRHSV